MSSGTYTPRHDRRLSGVLLRTTLIIAFILGTIAAGMQLLIDLNQQKRAVALVAEEFLSSLTPSAASAAYNYHLDAAEQVAGGLFTLDAVGSVKIINDGAVMVERSRDVTPTLPRFGPLTQSDVVYLSRPLTLEGATDGDAPFGEITIGVDRAIVPPAIINRMASYFLLSMVKNVVFGLALAAVVFGTLARHVLRLAEVTAAWRPGRGALAMPPTPRLLKRTEMDALGDRVAQMSDLAASAIDMVEENNAMLAAQSTALEKAVEERSEKLRLKSEELEAANTRLRRVADFDSLTGLHNRGAFERHSQEIYETLRHATAPLGLMMLDVDHFKSYNDFYGHIGGDNCLSRIGAAISDAINDRDVFAARFGGEEFVIMMSGCSLKDCQKFAQNLHDVISAANLEHQRSPTAHRVTVSIGLAWETPTKSSQLSDMINDSDEALYEAKRQGRNRTVYSTPAIRERARAQRDRRQDLMSAVHDRSFEPFFQPQFNALDGTLSGAEALVRWRRKDGSFDLPDTFIGHATEQGVVDLIDQIVAEKCLDFLREIDAMGITLPRLSINAVNEDLRNPFYIDAITTAAGVSDTQIAVELVETAFVEEFEGDMLARLDTLRSYGIHIEIDDFGTGHTSVLGLRVAAPDRLKIARELVSTLGSEEHGRDLVRCVVEMARILGIQTIGEGVETAREAQMLNAMGCTVHQGFFYAKPMQKDDLIALLRNGGQIASRVAS